MICTMHLIVYGMHLVLVKIISFFVISAYNEIKKLNTINKYNEKIKIKINDLCDIG